MPASEHEIFRVAKGLKMSASLARTLAHCLFWTQYATQTEGGIPTIWKTGPDLEKELGIAARTANQHLKKLASLDYWHISYRPRPGTIGPVTWLTPTDLSFRLLKLASQHAIERATAKSAKPPKGGATDQFDLPVCDDQSSQFVTSKQLGHTAKTAEVQSSFFLSSEAGKKGMNEPSPGKKKIYGKKEGVSPPTYLKVVDFH
ncbi:hypothetical protein [Sphingomonas sp. UYEF23]|uniref:hypothetical protein n=1 Tax=Sphingomonas sp. UYEF23 TaxID=1756408 RepID=UPI0033916D36